MILKRMNLIRENARGQSLVEMALVCMIFFFLLFGVLEFGRALWTYNTIVHQTRAAARWAVVNVPNNTENAQKVATRNLVVYGNTGGTGTPILPGLTTSLVTVSVLPIELDNSSPPLPISQKISVVVTGYQFQFLVPIAPTLTIPAYETSLYTESMGATS